MSGWWTRTAAFAAALFLLAGCTGAEPSGQVHSPTPLASNAASPGGIAGPRWFAVLREGKLRWFDSSTAKPIGESGGPARLRITSIGSWHDDRSVALAATGPTLGPCTSLLQRQRIDSPQQLTETELPKLGRVRGRVDEIAVSPDRSKLALAMYTSDGGDECDKPELLVADLTTGKRRVWTLPYSATSSQGPFADYGQQFVDHLEWAPDNRRLVLDHGECCAPSPGMWIFDTQDPPGRLLPRLHRLTPVVGCPDLAFAWTADGLLTDDNGAGCAGEQTSLVVVDPATSAARPFDNVLLPPTISQISIDAGGTHLLVYAGQSVYRVDGGRRQALMRLQWNPKAPPQVTW